MITSIGGIIIVVAIWGVIIMSNMMLFYYSEISYMETIIENQETIINLLNQTRGF